MDNVHFYRRIGSEFVAPCGASAGNRSLSSSWEVVDCPDCLRTHPAPIEHAACRPELDQTEPVYACGVCGEFHTQTAWAEYLDQRYDMDAMDTMGYAANDRAALRDAGRRYPL